MAGDAKICPLSALFHRTGMTSGRTRAEGERGRWLLRPGRCAKVCEGMSIFMKLHEDLMTFNVVHEFHRF